MQNKNIILAIVLSFGIMIGWNYVAKYIGLAPSDEQIAQRQAIQDAERETAAQQAALEATQKIETAALPTFTPAPGRDVVVDTPLYRAVLYSGGGTLRSFELKNYTYTIAKDSPNINLVTAKTAAVAPLGLLVNGQPSWSTGKWSFDGQDITIESGTASLQLTGEVDGMRIVRELTFFADTYQITEKIRIVSLGEQARSVRLGYTMAEDPSAIGNSQYDAMRIAWGKDNSFDEETDAEDLAAQGLLQQGNIMWASAMSTYFMSAIAPATTTDLTLKGRVQNNVFRVALEQSDIFVQPNTESQQDVTYWVGPKERALLENAPNNLISSIDLGMFSLIGKGLLWCLQFLQNYVHNWGLAIIALTIAIKILFWPLTAKSYKSMAKMRTLQPMMMALREKHADDKEALSKETMALYKTYGVNPAGGCVPMLVQIPVFFGLYQALMTSIELRHASFITYLPGTDMLWLADLSASDPFYITPILMGISMFVMQKMSPPMGDPMQQKIMMFLPIIFTLMFLGFPSGLVVYWLVNNILSIAQQGMMLRSMSK